MSNGNPLQTTAAYYNETTTAVRKNVAGPSMHEGSGV